MSEGEASLGKATLVLGADLADFQKNIEEGRKTSGGMKDSLDALAAVSKIANDALNKVKMSTAQGAETRSATDTIERSVGRVSVAALEAADRLDKVKLTSAQAAESDAAGVVIDRKLKDITGNANEARRSLESVKIASAGGGSSIGGTSTSILMPAIAAGTLLAPAAGPAVLGLLGSIPVLAAGAAGAVGVLALAFKGMGAAIGGDKKAFDALQPSQQGFVLTIRSLTGELDKLKQTAATNLFPGLTEGLKSALSPGTLGAVTAAVREFAQAIGAAGAAWGKYFGSAEFQSIFGPLMAAGARSLTTMSSAALSLFDAFGVLGRAAIPFTNWMTRGIAAGSAWADNFLHAKDATGALGGAMTEAEVSLRLVGNLFGSLLNAVYQLGAALYPVSKVAVKDLTDGLNALAKVFADNKQVIREIISTALSSLVASIKLAADGVRLFTEGLQHIVGQKASLITAILAVGAVITLTLGPEALVITGAILAVGLIEKNWKSISGAIVSSLKLLAGKIGDVLALMPKWIDPALHNAGVAMQDWANSTGASMGQSIAQGIAAGLKQAGALVAGASGSMYLKKNGGNGQSPADSGTMLPGQPSTPSTGTIMTTQQVYKLLIGAGFAPNDASNFVGIAKAESGLNYAALNNTSSTGDYSAGLFQENFYKSLGPSRTARYAPQFGLSPNMSPQAFVAWLQQHPAAQASIAADLFNSSGYSPWKGDPYVSAHPELLSGGGSPFGAVPAFTKNTGAASAAAKAKAAAAAAARALAARLQIPVTNDQTLAAHYKALAAAADTGPAITKNLDDEVKALQKENFDLAKSMQGKTDEQKARIRKQIGANEDTITKIHASIAQALDMSKEAGTFAKFQTKLAASSLKLSTDTAMSTLLSGTYLTKQHQLILDDEKSQATLLAGEAAKLKGLLSTSTGKLASQVRSQISTVTSKLTAINEQVLQGMAQMVQDAQAAFSTALSRLQSAADAQLQSQLAARIAALGSQFFQGGQTPAEALLAQMQAQDTVSSLQDALTQAQATGDQAQIAQAQRAIDENNLSIQATAERTKADADYAAAVKQATDDETARQQKLDAGLATYSDQMLNTGASTVNLGTLLDDAGVSVAALYVGGDSPFVALGNAAADLTSAFLNYTTALGGKNPAPGGASAYTQPSAGATAVRAALQSALQQSAIGLQGSQARQLGIPQMDVGGRILTDGLIYGHAGETVVPASVSSPFAGGGDIVLRVDGRELGRINADSLSRDHQALRVSAKALKPALSRVTSIG